MEDIESNINYLAILVATALSMVIGAAWYSQLMFVKPWMKLIGKTEFQGDTSNLPQLLVITAIANLITAYVLALALSYTQSQGLIEGALLGFWLWVGFVATTSLPNYLFKGQSLQLYLIESSNHLVALVVMGAVLASWPLS